VEVACSERSEHASHTSVCEEWDPCSLGSLQATSTELLIYCMHKKTSILGKAGKLVVAYIALSDEDLVYY